MDSAGENYQMDVCGDSSLVPFSLSVGYSVLGHLYLILRQLFIYLKLSLKT